MVHLLGSGLLALAASSVAYGADTGKNTTSMNSSESYTGPYTDGGVWKNGFAQAKALIAQMTIEERVNLTTGFSGRCVGLSGEVPRLGLTAFCLQDGTLGVRPVRRVTQFPPGVTVAATWDQELFKQRAQAISREFHDKGANIWLGPVTGGPLGRSPYGGRNWEGFGPDSYLNGVASYVSVKYAQQEGVVTCAKHFIAYEQETFRNPYNQTEHYSIFPPSVQSSISSNIDDKTTHEIYLWAFSEAVRAGAGTVMCSYNQVNGTQACANHHSLNNILKRELRFSGAVVSDWGGTWNTEASAIGGLDVSMPGTGQNHAYGNFFGNELVALVRNGTVSEARLDDMVLRILTPLLEFQNITTYPLPTFDVRDLSLPTNNVRRDHYKIAHKVAQDAITLVKNDGALPFKSDMQSLAIIGEDASVNPFGATSCGEFSKCPADANNGTFTAGGGSGWAYPSFVSDPLAAIQSHVGRLENGPDVNVYLHNWNLAAAAAQAAVSETALVFVNAYASETQDRANLTLWGNGDELIKAVAAVSNNTIVVMHIPGPVVVEEWIDHPNVTAVVIAHLPGEESGSSLFPVLWGQVSPSGRLPYTFAKKESDWPPKTIASDPVVKPQADFTEKVLVDYKWFDAKNITPRWEFGFGLSYTTFEYGSVSIADTFETDSTSIAPTAEKFQHSSKATQGESLYDVIAVVNTTVKNTGNMQSSEVPQLYVTFPSSESDQPPRSLRGFHKLSLAAGEQQATAFKLTRKDVSIWNVIAQRWEVPAGEFTLSVGSSSRKIHRTIQHTFA